MRARMLVRGVSWLAARAASVAPAALVAPAASVVAALLVLEAGLPARAAPAAGPPAHVTPGVVAEGQRQSRIAAGPDGFLVVWAAGVGGRSRIRAARVGLDGVSLDSSGFTIASAPGGQMEPAVAFGHDVYYVVWSDLRDGDFVIRGARVSAAGEVLDPGGTVLSTEPTAARMADVASTPDGFLVAWAQAEPAEHGFVARARRIGTDGQPVDPDPIVITDVQPWSYGEDFGHSVVSDVNCQHVRIAVQGQAAMIVWGGTVGRQQGYFIIRTVLDLASGTLTLPPDKAVVGAQSRLYNPVITTFGEGFVFSWTDFRERGGTGLPLDNAGLIALDGTVVYAPLQETHEARVVWAPAVAPNGVVAFIAPFENAQKDRRFEWHLVLRQLLPDATSPGSDVLVETNAAWPALATHPGGVTLLTYTLVNAAADSGMLFARLVTAE